MLALLLDDADGLQKVAACVCLAFCAVAFGQNDRDGRAQLVRGVGCELPLGVEGLFQPREHPVKRRAEPAHFARAALHIQPCAQILAGRDAVHRREDLFHRAHGRPRDEPAAADGDGEQDGQQCRREDGDRVHYARPVVGGNDAAHPEAGHVHVDIAVIDKVIPAAAADCAHDVWGKRQVRIEILRQRAVQKRAVRAVKLAVNTAAVHGQVVPLEFPAVEFHVLHILLYDVDQPPGGVVRDGVMIDHKHEHQSHCCQQQHHERDPRRDPDLDRHVNPPSVSSRCPRRCGSAWRQIRCPFFCADSRCTRPRHSFRPRSQSSRGCFRSFRA